ncbi:replication-associated recombination protein A [Dissulfurirhabdus thermomarina]|uniref:Replication-associated recombination protein A n=1 Tax=Dissulfurirhabdus thermomarina TaxID=1765737 RepID=A0A6N9TMA2_DISTH|nr:replication-associated recombination protein A [Dissulfurirhabdus thermomarina]NDY42402.1 replication-associated recombination protein A [Dissulfurirhabdus thermomarina]NMX23228.1 replication-associated recombination protein A [Dissulfurirhabdus thermomarina]
MRPRRLEDFAGQDHLLGPGRVLSGLLARGRLPSLILWGPPGCGKTTLARLLARAVNAHFVTLSAVLSGVKDLRQVIDEARGRLDAGEGPTVLFVDEIHRFNKAQQDAFLPHVESGLVTLVGATTENPSFEIIAPLLSRCRVLVLKPLPEEVLERILDQALSDPERGLGRLELELTPEARRVLVRQADGDARALLNCLETAAELAVGRRAEGRGARITLEVVEEAVQHKALRYDKAGEEHFNLISAFHKSLRGSDPDAALYWMARMLAAGEDPRYIARRMIRFASEDVGNADPAALRVALDAHEAYTVLGSPEGELALAQAALYLATAPKSNAAYTALGAAQADARKHGSLPVPLHIRNAPTRLMKELGYGEGYRYAHDDPDALVPQEYFPPQLRGRVYYHPTNRGHERTIRERLEKWRRLLARKRHPGA